MREANAEQADRGERADVRSEVARRLIDAMRTGDTPWQRPWSAAAMLPTNIATNNPYRGVNRLLLAVAAMEHASRTEGREEGRVDNRFMTYRQAAEHGWQVRAGSRGTPVVKWVEVGPGRGGPGEGAGEGGPGDGAGAAGEARRARLVPRRYTVFHASQIEGVPPLPEEAEPTWDPVEKAEGIMAALVERTGLKIVYGGDQALYAPSTDEVRLPHRGAFKSIPGVQAAYGFYSVALHECGHASGARHRLRREEAFGHRFGDEAYALEELTVEIASACLAAETGVPICHARPQAHIERHAGYLKSWIRAIERDPKAIFTAAKSAEAISDYLLCLERQRAASMWHEAWVADYERAEPRGR